MQNSPLSFRILFSSLFFGFITEQCQSMGYVSILDGAPLNEATFQTKVFDYVADHFSQVTGNTIALTCTSSTSMAAAAASTTTTTSNATPSCPSEDSVAKNSHRKLLALS